MVKMKERNGQLKEALGAIPTVDRIVESHSVPEYDTVNRNGYGAYSLQDELKLLSMLNVLKLQPQFYRTESETMQELRDLVERIGMKDPYFLAQCIVWSRCMGEGMRTINHLAAALAAPFIAGQPWGKSFYSLWDRRSGKGGCIYRPDDMNEIKDAYAALNKSALTNAMRKGFANAIEGLDTYQLAKYSKSIIDVSNLAHPDPSKSSATVDVDGKAMKTIDALMHGITVTADTWEAANSEAGQEVAKAVRDGKITKDEAKVVLAKAKNDNWAQLLCDGRLGILAALRNIRSMMQDPRKDVIDKLCELVSDERRIREGLIMPYQIDTAYEIVRSEFMDFQEAPRIMKALQDGYERSVPNLAAALPGKTCVMVDCSGSMWTNCRTGERTCINASCAEKAGLIAATIAKATNADVIRFGSDAEYAVVNYHKNVFALGGDISTSNMGGTNIGAAFELIRMRREKYDRIILLSDNECNHGNWVRYEYAQYIHDVCSPYVYCVDFAAYGTQVLHPSDRVNYYFGFGYAMFDDIASKEFNPSMHIDKVRKVVIDEKWHATACRKEAA